MFRKLSRREFLKGIAVGSLTAPMLLSGFSEILLAQSEVERQNIIWLHAQSSRVHQSMIFSLPDLLDLFQKRFNVLNYEHLKNLAKEGDTDKFEKTPILILEGYFPHENVKPQDNLLTQLINVSKTVIMLGSEASYSANAPEGFSDLEKESLTHTTTPFIRLPGMPVHSRHLLGTLNHLLLYGFPELDEYRRPTMFYSEKICVRCEYNSDFNAGNFVSHFGEKEGCLYLLGCKGKVTYNSCPVEKSNGTMSWCVSAGSPCIGCSEPIYPDHSGLGLFGQISKDKAGVNSALIRHLNEIALGAVALTVGGLTFHTASKRMSLPSSIETSFTYREDKE
ncbi:MAG: hypothetical protein OEY59_00550 [Deltaproteobacteria bacterium]|nr:hypothetical protein [Deltaproteobacteria bacterium]